MAYDPSANAALDRITHSSSRSFGQIFPLNGDTEYELKLGFTPHASRSNDNVVRLPSHMTPRATLQASEQQFMSLMNHFNVASGCNAPLGFQHDPAGLIPNDYVLVSLGLESKKTLPAAEFFLHDTQFRIRFPLHVHGNIDQNPYDRVHGHIDANLKSLLSKMSDGEHRIELETEIRNPLEALAEFKTKLATPSFMQEIKDEHLRISEVCMTSRTGFFVVTSVPGVPDAHILLHGCFDVSNYTTPSIETFTHETPRIEIELEAKLLLGNDPALADEARQKDYINRVFNCITQEAVHHAYTPYSLSKLEEAAMSVQNHYSRNLDNRGSIARIENYLKEKSIPPMLAYSLLQDRKVSDVFNNLQLHGQSAPISVLAAKLPDPHDLLAKSNPFTDKRLLAIA